MAKWKRTIRGINVAIADAANGQCSEQEAMGRIADILKKQPEWHKSELDCPAEHLEFCELVEEMSDSREDETMTVSYFDSLLAAMYDWADANRVWIEPIASLSSSRAA